MPTNIIIYECLFWVSEAHSRLDSSRKPCGTNVPCILHEYDNFFFFVAIIRESQFDWVDSSCLIFSFLPYFNYIVTSLSSGIKYGCQTLMTINIPSHGSDLVFFPGMTKRVLSVSFVLIGPDQCVEGDPQFPEGVCLDLLLPCFFHSQTL